MAHEEFDRLTRIDPGKRTREDRLPKTLGIRTFIKTHRRRLNKAFAIGWKRAPAHTAIRYILQGLKPADVEKVFREHAADLNCGTAPLI
jgi:hypothetical protein